VYIRVRVILALAIWEPPPPTAQLHVLDCCIAGEFGVSQLHAGEASQESGQTEALTTRGTREFPPPCSGSVRNRFPSMGRTSVSRVRRRFGGRCWNGELRAPGTATPLPRDLSPWTGQESFGDTIMGLLRVSSGHITHFRHCSPN